MGTLDRASHGLLAHGGRAGIFWNPRHRGYPLQDGLSRKEDFNRPSRTGIAELASMTTDFSGISWGLPPEASHFSGPSRGNRTFYPRDPDPRFTTTSRSAERFDRPPPF